MSGALVVDCETTGLGREDRIVSIALLWLGEDLSPVDAGQYWEFSPGRPSHPKAFEKHGLSDDYLISKPKFEVHAAEIHEAIEKARLVIAHNVDFDLRFINSEFGMAGLPEVRPPVFCTMAGVAAQWPRLGRSLDAAASRLKLARESERHDAREDARLAGAVFRQLRIEAAFAEAKRAAEPGKRVTRRSVVANIGPAQRVWSPPAPKERSPNRRVRETPEVITIKVDLSSSELAALPSPKPKKGLVSTVFWVAATIALVWFVFSR
jgi:DNA polymerase III subunit epsilon